MGGIDSDGAGGREHASALPGVPDIRITGREYQCTSSP